MHKIFFIKSFYCVAAGPSIRRRLRIYCQKSVLFCSSFNNVTVKVQSVKRWASRSRKKISIRLVILRGNLQIRWVLWISRGCGLFIYGLIHLRDKDTGGKLFTILTPNVKYCHQIVKIHEANCKYELTVKWKWCISPNHQTLSIIREQFCIN